MDSLGNSINQLINSNKALKKALDIYQLNKKWSQIVNPEIAQKTYIEKNIKSVLYVLTCSPVWSSQLSMLKRDIIKKINRTLKDDKIKDIKFKTKSLEEIQKLRSEILNEDDKKTYNIENYKKDYENVEKLRVLGDNLDGFVSEKMNKIYAKDKIVKKIRKDKGYKECSVCKRLSKTTNDICTICLSNIQSSKRNNIIKYFNETPWGGFIDFHELYPGIEEKLFHRVKQDLSLELIDSIRKKTSVFSKSQDLALKADIEKFIQRYVMLATSQPPHLITENIIQKKIGKFVYNTIYETRKDK